MGDTLSKMEDMQDRHPSGRPLDAKHTTLVAQEVPSRLERIAVQLLACVLASEEGPFTARELAEESVEYAKGLIEVLNKEGGNQ